MIAQGGVRTLRTQIYWGNIEPLPGRRDWDQSDQLVSDAARSGVELLPVLWGVPRWISDQPATPPIYSDSHRTAWTAFVRDLVARYGPSGSFWSLHPELPYSPITSIQVWNEVNLAFYWGGRPNARQYTELLRLANRALPDRGVDLIAAGVIPYKTIGVGSVPGDRYLRRLFRVKGARKLIDAVAVHPYGDSTRAVLVGIRRTRTALQSAGVRRPIWVTEFGWSTSGDNWRATPLRATLSQQARRVGKTYKAMRREAKQLGIRRAFYFSLKDTPLPSSNSWILYMGLFTADGNPKPAWFAYQRRAR